MPDDVDVEKGRREKFRLGDRRWAGRSPVVRWWCCGTCQWWQKTQWQRLMATTILLVVAGGGAGAWAPPSGAHHTGPRWPEDLRCAVFRARSLFDSAPFIILWGIPTTGIPLRRLRFAWVSHPVVHLWSGLRRPTAAHTQAGESVRLPSTGYEVRTSSFVALSNSICLLFRHPEQPIRGLYDPSSQDAVPREAS